MIWICKTHKQNKKHKERKQIITTNINALDNEKEKAHARTTLKIHTKKITTYTTTNNEHIK